VKKRTVATLVLAPLGAVLAVGIFRMIQHDWAVAPAPPKEEPTRVERPDRPEPETRPAGPSAGSIALRMRQLYEQGAGQVPPGKELAEFTQLAATLELRHLLTLLDEIDKDESPAPARLEFLLALDARWAALEPLQAWEKVRDHGFEAKETADRTAAVRRMAAILEVWSRADAPMALAAYLEAERGAEALRGLPDWWPALHTVLANAAKALGDQFPKRLRGMVSQRDHALALGQWAADRFLAGADPGAITAVLDEESLEALQATGGDEERLRTFRALAAQGLTRTWFERDPETSMAWLADRQGAPAVLDFLAAYPDPAEPAGFAERRDRVRQFLLARPEDGRDQWIASWLDKTRGSDLAMVAALASDDLRFRALKHAAWPEVEEKDPDFVPWACDPAEVRRVMDEIQLDEARRTEIEEILSVR
jgi:hypothetical protein